MFLFIVGLLIVAAAIIVPLVFSDILAPLFRYAAHTVGVGVGMLIIMWSTAIYVNDNQGGLVIVKLFADDLPASSIVATKGEKGPQATILPPGWHFGYWPWKYELHAVDNVTISEGNVGIVTALDGLPLPNGEVFAPEWNSPQDMIDGQKFLTSDQGFRGPQLSVLQPGQYRYNPRLFQIESKKYLSVPVGKVAIVKANAGPTYVPEEGKVVDAVNGTPIVPKGYRGIWQTALTPNAYYLHPNAYEVTLVSTTNRVYEYVDGKAINVRTKDGFEFPVDVRVAIKVTANEAPYIVAQFAQPDDDLDKNGFTTLEERAILPSIRAIFRNNAEDKGALEYVASRSSVENKANILFEQSLKPYRIQSDGVFIQDIGLSNTPQGQELLATQTDKEVAVQQQTTYQEQVRAQDQRAAVVRAEEEADQEKLKAAAAAQIKIKEDEGLALHKLAEGEAAAWSAKIEALGGIENFTRLEMLRMTLEELAKKWDGDLPTVVSGGGSGGNMDSLIGVMLKDFAAKSK